MASPPKKDSSIIFNFSPHNSGGKHTFREASTQNPHSHSESWEIHCFSDGTQSYYVGDELRFCRPETFVLVPPNVSHGPADGHFTRVTLFWLRFTLDPDWYPSIDESEREEVLRIFREMPLGKVFSLSSDMASSIDSLCRVARHHTGFNNTRIKNALGRLITDMCLVMTAPNPKKFGYSVEIQQALDWLHMNYGKDSSMDSIAEAVGLGVRQFHSRFRRETGYSPNEYRAHHRILVAMELLSKSYDNLTEIAFKTGFSTSQYFSTAFRRSTGVSPSEFRKRKGC